MGIENNTSVNSGLYAGINSGQVSERLVDLQNKVKQPGVNDVDATKLLQEISTLLNVLGKGGTPGVSSANGAPDIDGVSSDFSAEDMAAKLSSLQGKTQDAQMRTAAQGIKISESKINQQHTESIKRLEEYAANCAAAAEKTKAAGHSGWFGKIFGFIAAAVAVVVAVVATAGTAGGASPLLALAVVGLVGATISLASQISQECGGPALELSSLVKDLAIVIAKAIPGVSDEDAEKWGGAVASAIVVVVVGAATGGAGLAVMSMVDPGFVGMAVSSFAGINGSAEDMALTAGITSAVVAVGISIGMVFASPGAAASNVSKISSAGSKLAGAADEVANAGAKVASAVDDVARVADASSDVVQGAAKGVSTWQKAQTGVKLGGSIIQATASGVSGGMKIDQGKKTEDAAESQKVADDAMAAKQLVDAVIAKLMAAMEEHREEFKKILDEIQQGVTVVSQMINAASSSRSQIAVNIGQQNV